MAGPGASGRGNLGWLVLAAALAIPGFLFYNWWSHQKAEHDRSVAAKARSRATEGSVFQTPPAGARPLGTAVSTSAAPGAAPGAAPVPGAAAAVAVSMPAGVTPAAAATQVSPAAQAPSAAVNSAAANPAAAALAPVVAPVVSTTVAIVLSRDPMMSPMDLVRQREAEAEAERNAEAIRRAAEERNRPRRKVVRQEPKIDTHLELQGIVARPEGDSLAIVNGATVNEGEWFAVEGFSAKVKVVRITNTEVTFEYKGKRLKKNVNAE